MRKSEKQNVEESYLLDCDALFFVNTDVSEKRTACALNVKQFNISFFLIFTKILYVRKAFSKYVKIKKDGKM